MKKEIENLEILQGKEMGGDNGHDVEKGNDMGRAAHAVMAVYLPLPLVACKSCK